MDEDTITRTSRSPPLYTKCDPLPLIFHLPMEILESIFVLCAHQYSESYFYPTSSPPDWVHVSYVCRLWRSVALNCPTLWTYIFITSQRWTEELLARSCDASLKVNICMRFNNQISFWAIVRSIGPLLCHVERIEWLRLGLLPDFHRLFTVLSSHRAPRLKFLEIELYYPSDISTILFHGDTPALRTLRLTKFHFPWYSLSLRGLTALELVTVADQFKLPMEQFIAILGSMQNLEILNLREALLSASGFLSSESFDTFQAIDLPHLRCLWMYDSHLTIFALLSHVNIPLQAEIQLCSLWAESSGSLLPRRFSMSRNRALSSPTIRSLVIQFQHLGQARLFFSSLDDEALDLSDIEFEGVCHDVPLKIKTRFYFEPMTVIVSDGIISDICCSVPMPNMHTAHVFEPPLSSIFWSKVLGHLSDLRHLFLHGGDMPDLTSILRPTYDTDAGDPGGNAEDGPDQVLVPALEKLGLYRIAFPRPSSLHAPPAISVASLVDALASRRGSQGRIEMVGCIVPVDGHDMELDMVGRWEDGRFHVIQECSRPTKWGRAGSYRTRYGAPPSPQNL